MNKLQQKSWVRTYIDRIEEEILTQKFDIPDSWGATELMLYVGHCFNKVQISDLTSARAIEYNEFIESKKGPESEKV